MRAPRTQAPGLRWRSFDGQRIPTWFATKDARKAGYRPSRVDLAHLASNAPALVAQCQLLQAQMNLWLTGHRSDPADFDGSISALLSVYTTHANSSFQKVSPGTRRSYASAVQNLTATMGGTLLDSVSGVDLVRLQGEWSSNGKHLAAALIRRNVLLAAASFGVMLRLAGAAEFAAVLRETKGVFAHSAPRAQVLSAADVEALRRAAHAADAPERALAYALVFETTLRLYDVIGQWWPDGAGPESAIVDANGQKWFGLSWEDVDGDMVLRFTPSKTSKTSKIRVVYPLTLAPMVQEELRHWSAKARTGPVIVRASTGLPPAHSSFQDGWRSDRKAANLDKSFWARDLRASGITEARAAGANLDDAAKVAGHSTTKTTGAVYDRAALEAATRFAEARKSAR